MKSLKFAKKTISKEKRKMDEIENSDKVIHLQLMPMRENWSLWILIGHSGSGKSTIYNCIVSPLEQKHRTSSGIKSTTTMQDMMSNCMNPAEMSEKRFDGKEMYLVDTVGLDVVKKVEEFIGTLKVIVSRGLYASTGVIFCYKIGHKCQPNDVFFMKALMKSLGNVYVLMVFTHKDSHNYKSHNAEYKTSFMTNEEAAEGWISINKNDILEEMFINEANQHHVCVNSIIDYSLITESIKTQTGLNYTSRRLDKYGLTGFFLNPTERDIKSTDIIISDDWSGSEWFLTGVGILFGLPLAIVVAIVSSPVMILMGAYVAIRNKMMN